LSLTFRMTDELVALIVFALVSTGSPGGATSLATASGAKFGYARSVPLIAGIALTLGGLVALSGTGLAALILAVPSLAIGMKAVGTLYLLWLAVIIVKAGAPTDKNVKNAKPIGFFAGAMLLAINPKAWAMAVGVASSFSGLSDNPYVLAGVYAAVFVSAATLSLSLWAAVGLALSRMLRKDQHWHLFNVAMAALLILSIASLWI